MKTDEKRDVINLFYIAWEDFLWFSFPECNDEKIQKWVSEVFVEIKDGTLFCNFTAPIKWAEFEEYYNSFIQEITKALLDGVNSDTIMTRDIEDPT